MVFQTMLRYAAATALLVAMLAVVIADDPSETSTVSYEMGHELALTAFESISPDHTYLLGDEGPPEIVANELMDLALDKLHEMIAAANMDRIDIPEFQHDFDKKVAFFTVKGQFKGKEGWVQSLLSIQRSGDAVLRVDGTSLVLDAPLGMTKLELGMKFEATFAGLTVKGNLKGHVISNSVFLSNALDYSTGKCQLQIRSLEVKDLGKIFVEVTGLGELDSISSLVASWVTDITHDTIRKAVNQVLFDILKSEIKKTTCPNLTQAPSR